MYNKIKSVATGKEALINKEVKISAEDNGFVMVLSLGEDTTVFKATGKIKKEGMVFDANYEFEAEEYSAIESTMIEFFSEGIIFIKLQFGN